MVKGTAKEVRPKITMGHETKFSRFVRSIRLPCNFDFLMSLARACSSARHTRRFVIALRRLASNTRIMTTVEEEKDEFCDAQEESLNEADAHDEEKDGKFEEAHEGSEGEEEEEEEEPGEPSEEDIARGKELQEKAEALKAEGNSLFGQRLFEEAAAKYREAIAIAPHSHPSTAVYYSNLAAAMMQQAPIDETTSSRKARMTEAARSCSSAIEIDPAFIKGYMRRSAALEQLDDLDNALGDAKKVLELDPGNDWAKGVVKKLEPIVAERHEKLKTEMMGKLKDLGNSLLGHFGMSLDNFKAEKDPSTGSYSIKFEQ